jgi:PTS system fructose-specific IIA component
MGALVKLKPKEVQQMQPVRLIDVRNVLLDAAVSSKEELFDLVAVRAEEEGVTSDPEALVGDLEAREGQLATGLMDGFAIPHTKSANVQKVSVFFVRTKEPIAWEMMDDSQARYFFVLLVPLENEGNIHLQMISELATCLLEDEFKSRVKSSDNSAELGDYINGKVIIGGEEQ